MSPEGGKRDLSLQDLLLPWQSGAAGTTLEHPQQPQSPPQIPENSAGVAEV